MVKTALAVVAGHGPWHGCGGGWHTWGQSAHHASPILNMSGPEVVVVCRTQLKSCEKDMSWRNDNWIKKHAGKCKYVVGSVIPLTIVYLTKNHDCKSYQDWSLTCANFCYKKEWMKVHYSAFLQATALLQGKFSDKTNTLYFSWWLYRKSQGRITSQLFSLGNTEV